MSKLPDCEVRAMGKYVLGIDYGTLSARCVVVDASNGSIVASHAIAYPHGVMTENLPDLTPLPPKWALADANDYDSILIDVVKTAVKKSGVDAGDVYGMCVDATSLTLVVTDESGRALSTYPNLAARPHAYIKLWKQHAALPQAERLRKAALSANEPFVRRCGMSPSSEGTLPKLMQMREEDPEVFDLAAYALDLCDYLTWKLTGRLTRSIGSAGFKSSYTEHGYPSKAFLDTLYPGFGDQFHQKLSGPILNQGDAAGGLTSEMARQMGLKEGVIVAAGAVDGHTSLIAAGMVEAGDAAVVVGTSNALGIITDRLVEIPDICGIAFGGLGPKLYGIDMGQSATGDMLHWYMDHCLPESCAREAREQGISPHTLLSNKAQAGRPWACSLTVLDWWAGSRNAPCDLSMTGAIHGLTLATRPEDIYLALLNGIACGTRRSIEQCENYAVTVKNLVACGGIPAKNPFFMRQYANLLHRPIIALGVSEGPALGSAIYAAVAAGLYSSLEEAASHMKIDERTTYLPDDTHAAEYEAIYQRTKKLGGLLRESFSLNR